MPPKREGPKAGRGPIRRPSTSGMPDSHGPHDLDFCFRVSGHFCVPPGVRKNGPKRDRNQDRGAMRIGHTGCGDAANRPGSGLRPFSFGGHRSMRPRNPAPREFAMSSATKSEAHPPRAAFRFRQGGAGGLRPGPGAPWRGADLDRRHGQGAARGRAYRRRRRRGHRLSGDDGRARQDAAPHDPWRLPGAARQARARGRDEGARDRGHRSSGLQSLSVRGDGGEGRRLRRDHREHRYRRPGDDALGRQEPRMGHGRRRCRGL